MGSRASKGAVTKARAGPAATAAAAKTEATSTVVVAAVGKGSEKGGAALIESLRADYPGVSFRAVPASVPRGYGGRGSGRYLLHRLAQSADAFVVVAFGEVDAASSARVAGVLGSLNLKTQRVLVAPAGHELLKAHNLARRTVGPDSALALVEVPTAADCARVSCQPAARAVLDRLGASGGAKQAAVAAVA